MYVIMRRLPGYKHLDFLRDDFMASHYFALIHLIKEDIEEEKKAHEDARKKAKRR